MSDSTVVEVRRGAYHDSVTLMQVSRDVAAVDGVHGRAGRDGHRAQPRPAARHGLRRAGRRGRQRHGASRSAPPTTTRSRGRRPRSTQALARSRRPAGPAAGSAQRPAAAHRRRRRPAAYRQANLALVSVPGPHAFTEAMDALEAGLSRAGVQRQRPGRAGGAAQGRGRAARPAGDGPGLRHRGVGGVGLGFANAVPPGPVGLVAASRHRRPAADVPARRAPASGSATASASAGATCPRRSAAAPTRQALALLDADPATELIVLVSKPPRPEVADDVATYAAVAGARRCSSRCSGAGPARPHRRPRARAVEAVGGDLAPSRGPGTGSRSRPAAPRAARAVRRRHAVRRGDGHRGRRALGDRSRSNIPLRPGAGPSARRPARRRSPDDRLRRRRADPGPARTR